MFVDSSTSRSLKFLSKLVYETGEFKLFAGLTSAAALLSPTLLLPLLLGLVSERVVHTAELSLLYQLALLTCFLATMGLVLHLASQHCAAKINSSICQRLLQQGYQQLLLARDTDLHSEKTSLWASYLTDNLIALQRQQYFVLQNAPGSMLTVLIAMLLITVIHPAFLLPVLALLFLTNLLPILVSAGAQGFIQAEPENMARLNNASLSVLEGREVLCWRGQKAYERILLPVLKKMLFNQGQKWIRWNWAFNLKTSLNLLCYLLVLAIGGWLYLAEIITLGQLLLTYVLVSMLSPKLDNLYKSYNYLQAVAGYYQALQDIYDLRTFPGEDMAVSGLLQKVQLKETGTAAARGKTSAELELTRGNILLLQGSSGLGKSSILKKLAAIDNHSNTRLKLNDVAFCRGNEPELWAQLAYQPQQQWLLEQLSAWDNIMLPAKNFSSQRLEQAICSLELQPLLSLPVSQLSGGERQRLCFVRSFICEAQIYLFDEPSSALEPEMESRLFQLITELKDKLVCVVSHSEQASRYFGLAHSLDVQEFSPLSCSGVKG